MLHKLEKYAADLESIVGQRTGELVSEKLKSDTLLYSMLPKLVVDDWCFASYKRHKELCCQQVK